MNRRTLLASALALLMPWRKKPTPTYMGVPVEFREGLDRYAYVSPRLPYYKVAPDGTLSYHRADGSYI